MADVSDETMLVRAGFWRRFLALIVDLVIAILLLQTVAVIAYPLSAGRIQSTGGLTYCVHTPLTAANTPKEWQPQPGFHFTTSYDCTLRSFFFMPMGRLRGLAQQQDKPSDVTQTITYTVMIDNLGFQTPTYWYLDTSNYTLIVLLLLRCLGDGMGWDPGRKIAKLCVVTHSGGKAEPRSLALRMLLFAIPIAPAILFLMLLNAGVISIGSIRMWGLSCLAWAVVLYGISAVRAAQRKDAFYDRAAGTMVALRPVAAQGLDRQAGEVFQ